MINYSLTIDLSPYNNFDPFVSKIDLAHEGYND